MNPLLIGLTVISALTSISLHADPLPLIAPAPADNPSTREKIELGKQLFFDGRLSVDGTISCNSCHGVNTAGVDGKQFSDGVKGQKGGRNSPTVYNAAFMSVQFWDGRAASLEDQAKGPMINPVEMGQADHTVIVANIRKTPEYLKQFEKVFGGKNPVTIDNIVRAIAAFERTLITPDSPYDRFKKGDGNALSDAAQRGLKLVQQTGCLACHSGPNFAGPPFKVGTGFYQKFPVFAGSTYEKKYDLTKDKGRFEATKKDTDKNFWRVPTWRNIADTAPYFHNGSVATLDEAVRVMAKTQLNKELDDAQVSDIVEFLKSLSGTRPKIREPKLPPNGNG